MEKEMSSKTGRMIYGPFSDYCYVDTALGDVRFRNKVKKIDQINLPDPPIECYLSMFRFRKELQDHCESTGSVRDIASFPCYCDYLWFDIDSNDLRQAIINASTLIIEIERRYGIPADQLTLSFSGCKGFHIGIPSTAFGAEPSADLPQIFRKMAQEIAGDIKIDTAIYDKNRLWRLPNSINGKSGLFKIPLNYEELAKLDSDAIKKLAGGKRELPDAANIILTPQLAESTNLFNKARAENVQQKIGEAKTYSSVPNSIDEGWITKALLDLEEGNRNTAFTRITGRLHQNNMEPRDILTLLAPHAAACRFPPDELRQLVYGICLRYPLPDSVSDFHTIYREKSETESEPPKIIALRDFMAIEDTEISWCVKDIFPTEWVGIIASPAGYGKSWMLIDLAIECARGGRWLGQFDAEQGVVLYIDEESSPQLLRHRYKKVMDGKGIDGHHLDIHVLVGSGICLNDNNSVVQLRQFIRYINPAVVIIDSLIRVHRADENSAKEMSHVFANVKDLIREGNCLCVFADHQRKLGHFRQSGDQQLRGSTEKVAFIDTLLSLQKVNERLVVEHSKSRFAEPVSNFAISIEDLSPGTTAVVYQGPADELKKQERLKEANEFLGQAIPDEDWISRKDLVKRAKEMNVNVKALDEALKELESIGQIERDDRKSEGRGGKAAFFRRVIPENSSAKELIGLT